jgi:hypothetical protein
VTNPPSLVRFPWVRGLLVVSFLGLIVFSNLNSAPRPEKLFYNDLEFSVPDQLDTARHWWYLRWGLVWLPTKLDAVHFMCVPEGTRHGEFLSQPWNLRGTKVVSDCDPLDVTDRRADQLHPNLITEDLGVRRVFFAYDPTYEPVGDWAILVEAKEKTYVMVHTDTLRHLGLYDGTVPE